MNEDDYRKYIGALLDNNKMLNYQSITTTTYVAMPEEDKVCSICGESINIGNLCKNCGEILENPINKEAIHHMMKRMIKLEELI